MNSSDLQQRLALFRVVRVVRRGDVDEIRSVEDSKVELKLKLFKTFHVDSLCSFAFRRAIHVLLQSLTASSSVAVLGMFGRQVDASDRAAARVGAETSELLAAALLRCAASLAAALDLPVDGALRGARVAGLADVVQDARRIHSGRQALLQQRSGASCRPAALVHRSLAPFGILEGIVAVVVVGIVAGILRAAFDGFAGDVRQVPWTMLRLLLA